MISPVILDNKVIASQEGTAIIVSLAGSILFSSIAEGYR